MSLTAIIYQGPWDQRYVDAAAPAELEPVGWFSDSLETRSRDGLARALEAIAAGQAATLYVRHLSFVASSLGELSRLLDWLEQSGASLVASDVGLDTSDRAGRRSVALLREVDGWGRVGDERRRPRGRPGLKAGAPELAERITRLRQDGLSLQAIADRLNAEGVATPRGGASWRPSSVQSALGYRRPRPPAPGAPPPPPGPPGRRHGKGSAPPRPGGGKPGLAARPGGGKDDPPPPPRQR